MILQALQRALDEIETANGGTLPPVLIEVRSGNEHHGDATFLPGNVPAPNTDIAVQTIVVITDAANPPVYVDIGDIISVTKYVAP